MPSTTWRELDDIIHRLKNTLTKMVGIELMCKMIKKDAIIKMEEIEKYCIMVKKDAAEEMDILNTIILKFADEKDEVLDDAEIT